MKKKLKDPVTLFAKIPSKQYEAIRTIAFKEHRSIADIVRRAINYYLKLRDKK